MNDADAILRIRCDNTEAGIAAHGGGIRFLSAADRAIIPLDTDRARSQWSSGATLAPWPNRLRNGRWEFEGEQLAVPASEANGNALHGLVAHHVFAVESHAQDSITLRTHLGDDAGYPFPAEVRISYKLAGNGLTVRMSARNTGVHRIPMALGAHPYFPWKPGCTVQLDASSFCEVDEILIPTGALVAPEALGITPSQETPIDGIALDHCFTDLDRDVAGIARTAITYPDGTRTVVWQDDALPYVQVFTTTEECLWQSDTSHAIAIEPQTAPANAFNSRKDLVWLDPDDERTARAAWVGTPRPTNTRAALPWVDGGQGEQGY